MDAYRRTPSRRPLVVAGVVLIAALLPAVFGGGAAGAKGRDPSTGDGPLRATVPVEPVASRSELESRAYNRADLEAMAALNMTTLEQARHRMMVEDAAIGLEQRVRERWADTFAGVWITPDADARIAVAFAGALEQATRQAEVAEMTVMPEVVSVTSVVRSLVELETLQADLITERTGVQSGRPTPEPAINRTQGRYDLDIDITRNTVVVLSAARASDRQEQQAAFDRR